MNMNIDTGFLVKLNEKTGLSLTWKEFVQIYRERKNERDADPVRQARKRRWYQNLEESMDLHEFTEHEIMEAAEVPRCATKRAPSQRNKSGAVE